MAASRFLTELEGIVGDEHLLREPAAIQKLLRDNSWLSPVLTQYIDRLRDDGGQALRVDAVAVPADSAQLKAVVACAVRHAVPMIVRGGGTSNFGQIIPLRGGLIIDTRRLAGIVAQDETSITALAGTRQGEVDQAARARGKELTVLTTTYATATAAGWVAGGHVGLGANTYGTIWDGNVLRVRLLTAEDPPRELELAGARLLPALHTYGVTGVMTEVTFPLVAAREWLEAVAVFDTFEAANAYTTAVAEEVGIVQRVVTAQDGAISRAFTPLRGLYREGQAVVLMIFDMAHAARVEALCRAGGGTWHPWRADRNDERISLGLMVYGHRMLWLKRLAPAAAFLHVYFSPSDWGAQLEALQRRFGADIWHEFKYIRSAWLRRLRGLPPAGLLPAAVLTLVPGGGAFLETVMKYCDSIGVSYLNPHTFLLEESGLFPDFAPIAAFKREVDPLNLLNPGKIGERWLRAPEETRA